MSLRFAAYLFAVLGSAAPGAVFTATQASAQEGALFKNLFEGGALFGGPKEDIEYRERAPLVVPPALKLPAPQQRAGQRNAAWPNDPDVAAKREANANALLPATEREKYKLDRNPLLSQEELRRGRDPSRQNNVPYRPEGENANEQLIQPIIVGRELAARRNAKDDLTALSGVEPERKYLSDPPTGLRKPIGSLKGIGESQEPIRNNDPTNQKEFAQGLIRR